MRPPVTNRWVAVAALGGLAYPFLVYVSLPILPPSVLLFVGLGLIALRIAGLRRSPGGSAWVMALLLAGIGVAALVPLSPALAVKAYPVAISLAVAAVFALSLCFPPTVVERLARLTEPDLPPQGVAYTRKVTWVWLLFLLANALISAASALWGTIEQWTLWNGFLSYLAMGLLFGGEFILRQTLRRRQRRAAP